MTPLIHTVIYVLLIIVVINISGTLSRFIFFFIIELITRIYHWIELGNHNRTLRYNPKVASGEFIHEMRKNVVVFLLSFRLLDGKL